MTLSRSTVDELLRHTGQIRGGQGADLWSLARGGHELIEIGGKELGVASRTVFENEGDAARCADTGNGGRRKSERDAFRLFGKCRIDPCFDGLKLLLPAFPLVPLLHADEGEGVVTGADKAQQAEAGDGGDVIHARDLRCHLLQLRHYRFRSLQGCRVGQLDVHVEVALVFIGHKTGGQFAADPQAGHGEADQKHHRDRRFVQE